MAEHQRAFICGWPVEHSRSPIIHNYWLKTHRISGEYIKIPVPPADFSNFVTNIAAKQLLGGNITLPHKENAFELVQALDPVAKRLGAVNTVWLQNGVLHGANTDGYGFLANLDQQSPGWDKLLDNQKMAIVLGAGGASRAIIDALFSRGFANIKIVNRTIAKASNIAGQYDKGVSAHQWNEIPALMRNASLLVNTTSLGMIGKQPLDIDLTPLPDHCLVSDIVYVPLKTPLLRQAENRGLKTVDGLGMLLHQAVPGFEKWFAIKPEVTPQLRQLVINDLADN